MATELLATGINAATSATFDLVEGQSANIFLKGEEAGTAPDLVAIEIEDDASGWTVVDYLGEGAFARNIIGPGTFRVRRIDGLGKSVGVSRA